MSLSMFSSRGARGPTGQGSFPQSKDPAVDAAGNIKAQPQLNFEQFKALLNDTKAKIPVDNLILVKDLTSFYAYDDIVGVYSNTIGKYVVDMYVNTPTEHCNSDKGLVPIGEPQPVVSFNVDHTYCAVHMPVPTNYNIRISSALVGSNQKAGLLKVSPMVPFDPDSTSWFNVVPQYSSYGGQFQGCCLEARNTGRPGAIPGWLYLDKHSPNVEIHLQIYNGKTLQQEYLVASKAVNISAAVGTTYTAVVTIPGDVQDDGTLFKERVGECPVPVGYTLVLTGEANGVGLNTLANSLYLQQYNLENMIEARNLLKNTPDWLATAA